MACEMNFWDMVEALPEETRERILREREEAMGFACEPEAPPAQPEQSPPSTPEAEPKP